MALLPTCMTCPIHDLFHIQPTQVNSIAKYPSKMTITKLSSKLEINLLRLLSKTEYMMQNYNTDINNWRVEKYVCALEELLTDLKRSPNCPDQEILSEYSSRISFLKGLLQTEKLPTAIEKSMASQITGPGSAAKHEKVSREIHLQTTAKYEHEMRRELFGSPDKSELKHRNVTSSPSTEDLDAILAHHQTTQEKVAEEMIMLVRNMKANTILANTVVKQDIETVNKSNDLADRNFSKLKVESENLEAHSSRACHWWIWTALGIVCLTFIATVIFMKLFPKS